MRVMVLFLISTRVYSAILRLPCAKYADFCIIEEDKRMEGHVLMEIRNTDDAQCTVECVQQPKCRSYNLEINERICQLNSKALADEGTILVSKPGWVYKSTDYNSTLLGTACEQLNPCAQGILCKDKCDLPYFECIHCDKYHYGLHCDRRRDLDECASNPCKNGAVCVEKVADYSCTCLPGYTGKNCEQDINECGSFPCRNGGTCKDEVNNFSCTCVPGFSGSKCETTRSCKEIKENDPSSQNGVYELSSGKHYCFMEGSEGCEGGGWTLVLKADGNKPTFGPTSAYWTDDNVYNVENGLQSVVSAEAKFAGFSKVGFTHICVAMHYSGDTKRINITRTQTSLLEVFKNNVYQPTYLGKDTWKSLISDVSFQNNCNREGFNVKDDNNRLSMRLGILGNGENDCRTCDSYIGFGSRWGKSSGSKYKKTMGFLLVR